MTEHIEPSNNTHESKTANSQASTQLEAQAHPMIAEQASNETSLKPYVMGAILALLVCVPVMIGLGWRLYQHNSNELKQVIAIRLDTILNEREKAFVEQTKNIDLNDKTQATLALEQIKTFKQTIETQMNDWQESCQCVLINPRGVYRNREALEDQTQAFMDELNVRIAKSAQGKTHAR